MIEVALWSALPVAGVAGTLTWAARHPRAQLFGPTVYRTPRVAGRKSFALTFDDGPNPAVTPRLLDLLEKHRAHATFFLIGKFVRECPELVQEIAARGHAIGNHTDTHPDLIWLSSARIREELRRCEESIGEALRAGNGARTKRWLRPPYGARGPQLEAVRRSEGILGVVMWSVLCWDWKPQPASRLIGRLNRAGDGDIVVMHDGDYRAQNGDRGHVVEALAHWLPRWRDAGFEFVTMDAAAAD